MHGSFKFCIISSSTSCRKIQAGCAASSSERFIDGSACCLKVKKMFV